MTNQASQQVDALAGEHREDFGPAMQWLVAHPAEARPALLQLLRENRDDLATRRAFDVLGRIGDAADVSVLAARLRDARGTLAGDAAHGLALHPATAAGDALVSAAQSGELDVATAATTGLEERRDPGTRSALESLLDHASPSIRYRAVRAIRAIGIAPSRAALQRRRAIETDPDVQALLDEALAASGT
jgi:HEAT repeat protein